MGRRTIEFLLCILLMLGGMSATAEETTQTDTALELAQAYLGAVGISDEFVSQEQISRGEFIQLLVAVSAMEESGLEGELPFDDVGATYEEAVKIAYEMKIIDGSGGRLFRPDDGITCLEAVKMTVDALGYRAVAAVSGGYPTGYMLLAGRLKLLKSIRASGEEPLSGRDTAVLLQAALTAELAEPSGYGDEITYVTQENRTLLSERHELTVTEGIVTATEVTSLASSEERASSGCVEIGGKSYRYDQREWNALGQNVIGFLNGEGELIYFAPYKNDSVNIAAGDLEELDGLRLRVTEESGGKRYTLDKSFCVIYNGKAISTWNSADFFIQSGFIRLLDNNRDGEYDVVFLTDIHYMEMGSYDDLNRRITGSGGLVIDAGDTQTQYDFIRWDGEMLWTAEAADFANATVVGYALSKDSLAGTVYLCEKTVSGKVTGWAEEEIYIDDVPYKVTEEFQSKYGSVLGSEGNFTVSPDGKIVAFEKGSRGDEQYGYLIQVGYQNRGLQSGLQMKLLTQTEGVQIYDVDEDYTIDGKKPTQQTEELILKDDTAVQQFLKYRLDENQKIVNLDLAYQQQEVIENHHQSGDNLVCYLKGLSSPVKSASGIFSRFVLGTGTAIFVVPPVSKGDTDEDSFQVVSKSFFENDVTYTVDVYDMDNSGYPAALVCYGDAQKAIGNTSELAVVEKVVDYDASNEEENVLGKKVYLWRNGRYGAYLVKNNLSINKENGQQMAAGDIIRINVANGNIISAINIDFDASSMEFTTQGKQCVFGDLGYNRLLSYTKGSVALKRGAQYYITSVKSGEQYDYSLQNLRPFTANNNQCVLVNRKTGAVRPMFTSEIYDYYTAGDQASEVVLCQRYWETQQLVVYVEGK